MWGTLLADIVIQMLGTDYARIVQAIYAFAQVKIMKFHLSYHVVLFCLVSLIHFCLSEQIRLTRTSYIEPHEE